MSSEIWKTLSWAKYDVSSVGNVRSHRFMKPIKASVNSSGYLRVSIGSVKNRKFVHRLVAEMFCDNPKDKRFVNHKNGNKLDNNASNLEWVTGSENDIHKYSTGLAKPKRCEDSPKSKLNAVQILEIVKLLNQRESCTKIAKSFGVHRKTINDIKQGKTWNSLTNGKLLI